MRVSRSPIPTTIAFVALLGCNAPSDDATKSAHTPEPTTERSARTLPLPSAAPAPEIPQVGNDASGSQLAWIVPAGWIEQPPAVPMRFAQYRVPGDAGFAECVVFYFGPGQGGDAMANIERWAGQFKQPDGAKSLDRLRTTHLDTIVPVVIAELTGTYDGGMGMTDAPAAPQPGAMLLGAIASGPDAPWFFKFTGPEPTVRAQRPAFEKLLASLHPAP